MTTPIYFPLHAVNFSAVGAPVCGCGKVDCKDVGVHPSLRYRTVTETVPSPSGRYGVRTGEGIMVVDIDRKNGKDGLPSWERLCLTHGVPQTRVIRTPSGGFHFYFACAEPIANSQGALADGIDVRGSGGFVVAEGTTGRNGVTPYECVQDLPIAPLPEWLAALCRKRRTSKPDPTQSDLAPIDLSQEELARRLSLFSHEVSTWPPSVQGSGGSNTLWGLVIRGVRHYALPPDTVRAMLNPYSDRCIPPWSAEELDHKIQDALTADVPLSTVEPVEFVDVLTQGYREFLAKSVLPKPTSIRRKRTPGHSYSFAPELLDYGVKCRGGSLLECVSILSRHPLWTGVFQWDEFLRRTIAIDPPTLLEGERTGLTRADIGIVKCWLGAQGVAVSQEIVDDAICIAAKSCRIDSAQDWLATIPDTMPRGEAYALIRELVVRGFGADDDHGAVLFTMRHLIGAVRRIEIPGYQHDHCLILSGAKGLKKTTALRALFPPEFFRAQMPSLHDRDGSHALEGFVGILFDEIGYVFRHDGEALKSYIIRQEDTYRQFGNGDRVRALRRCTFFGTTNADATLIRDAELDRRWLIVAVNRRGNPEWIEANRLAIWSAVKSLALTELSYLTDDEIHLHLAKAQCAHRSEDTWDHAVESYLAKTYPEGRADTGKAAFLATVFVGLFGQYDPIACLRSFSTADRVRVRDALTRLGWASRPLRVDGGVSRLWCRA